MANVVGGVEYEVKLDQNKVTSSLKATGNKILKWGNRIGNLVGGLLGFSMFNQAKRGWEDLQASLRQVSALTQGKTNIKELTKLADEMATKFGEDAAHSVDAFYQSISAGFSEDASKKLVKIANELSAAATASGEMLDAKGAINALTTVLNAFGLSADHARTVADGLTNAVNFGKTSINELAQSISTVAPIASAFGVSIDDVLINLSALTQAGVDTATATVGLRQMISELSKSSTSAGKALQDNLGLSFAEATKKGMTLDEILRDGLLPSVNGNTQGFMNLFGNIRAATTAITLANDNFGLATKIQKGFKDSIDSTAKGANAFTNNSLTKWKAGLQKVKVVLVSLIDSVGGLGNALTIVMGIFAAFKVANFVVKIMEAVSAFSALAVAKSAATAGIGAPVAVAATVAAIGAGLTAVAAIGGTVASGILMNGSGSSSSSTTSQQATQQKGRTIVVNVSSVTGEASTNTPNTNVQTLMGGVL